MASEELQAAIDAAHAAAVVIQGLYRRNLKVTIKADKSPVTEADTRAEQAIREVLRARFPDYGFYGEETGRHAMDADNIWLVDPIDGTKSFVRECPFFSTQIALLRGGRLVLGVWRDGLGRAGRRCAAGWPTAARECREGAGRRHSLDRKS